MLILALDTCLAACQAALWRDGETVAQISESMTRGHQERLAPMVQTLMRDAKTRMAQIDRVAVTVGPGSFTGLRVGLAFAKGLALALDRPLIGINALEALAASVVGDGLCVALVDARRDQAYWQAFLDGRAVTAPQAWAVADIADWIVEHGPPATLVGPGAGLLSARFRDARTQPLIAAEPSVIAALAAGRDPAPARPLYLRTPDAKLPGGIDPFA